MDSSERCDDILALGRKLVDELGLESSVDTLGRWMAHYIADLIVKSEGAAGEEKELADKKCFDAILTLWEHRAELPNGKRPFEELEPVVRTIESLDPDDDSPRYFCAAWPQKDESEIESESDTWLAMARGLDYSSKLLIGYCLAEAARNAADQSKDWVKHAEAAGAESGVWKMVIRFVSNRDALGEEPDPVSDLRQVLQDRTERLESFIELAEAVAADFKARLAALPSDTKDAD